MVDFHVESCLEYHLTSFDEEDIVKEERSNKHSLTSLFLVGFTNLVQDNSPSFLSPFFSV